MHRLGLIRWGVGTRPSLMVCDAPASSDRARRSTANRVDVSARVSGRVIKLGADVGDTVEQGKVIADLESPELIAALGAVHAALGVAKADLERVTRIRPETVTARKAELAAADADVVLYQEMYNRQAQLAKTGNTPQSQSTGSQGLALDSVPQPRPTPV